MARSLNKIQIIGNCGNDPEVRVSASGGTKVVTLSVATASRVKKGNDWGEETDWHRITCFGKLADIVEEYVKKGDRIYVEGRVKYEEYNGKWYTQVIARELIMLSSNGGSGGGSKPAGGRYSEPEKKAAPKAAPDDDLPF